MFQKLYKKCLDLASHKSSNFYLGLVSFIESSFFPIPPDVMIIPMVIAKKRELTVGTIEGHLAYFIENGELEISKIIPKKKLEKAKRIILASKHESLSELKEILGSEYSWGELRIILKWMND